MSEFDFEYNPYSMLNREEQYRHWQNIMQTPILFGFNDVPGGMFEAMRKYLSNCEDLVIEEYTVEAHSKVTFSVKLAVRRTPEGKKAIIAFFETFYPSLSKEIYWDGFNMSRFDEVTSNNSHLPVATRPIREFEFSNTAALMCELQKAIEDEDYERAAEIRNEIDRRGEIR